LEPVRRKAFEIFYFPHQIILPIGLLLAILHDLNMIFWLSVPFGLYLFDRLIRFWRGCVSTTVVSAKVLDSSVTRLELKQHGFHFKGGAYCFLNIPSISKWQWHPFSLSCGPNRDGLLRFHILDMGQGTFTGRLTEFVLIDKGQNLTVKVDGPYGALSIPIYQGYSHILLCSGGVGVTPMMSILMELNQLAASGNVPDVQQVHFVWVAKGEEAFKQWFPDLMNDVAALQKEGKVKLHLYATRRKARKMESIADPSAINLAVLDASGSSDEMEEGKKVVAPQGLEILEGRPNYAQIFASLCKDGHTPGKVAVLACGPPSLVHSVQTETQKLGWHFHKETFLL
jgi:respiratory burst oxidase